MAKMTNFRYYNRRPDGKHKEDCVTRAISTATGLKYGAVANLLELSASEYECDKLCVCCYHYLLEEILCYPVKYCMDRERVNDVVNMYQHNTLIIRIQGHLTSSINGRLLDIWDCGDERVDCFWIIK